MFGAVAGWWSNEVEWCTSTASMMAGLDGVVQRGLGDGFTLLYSRRAEALSCAMVASMASMVRGFTTI
jgi:hypothetical protein